MRKLLKRLFGNAGVPTNNPGTGLPPESETLKVLKSIDARLARLESCVAGRDGNRNPAFRTTARYQ